MKTVVAFYDISKKYFLGSESASYALLKEELARGFRHCNVPARRKSRESIWALQNVSFQLAQGEVLGVIGSNGAGKSTLLKIIQGLTLPTQGRAVVVGRVGSLIDIGTGFHPELTGRENIFLNGALIGLTHKKVVEKFEEIVEFSGIEKFLDTPLKHYSSGMCARLAFAVASHIDVDILLIDETLSVGDVEFQLKCIKKMENIIATGKTIIFVSHQLERIEQLCHRALVLEQGKVIVDLPGHQVVDYYRTRVRARFESSAENFYNQENRTPVCPARSEGNAKNVFFVSGVSERDLAEWKATGWKVEGDVVIKEIWVENEDNEVITQVTTGQHVVFCFKCRAKNDFANLIVGFAFHDVFDNCIFRCDSRNSLLFFDGSAGQHIFYCSVPHFPLMPGTYSLRAILVGNNGSIFDFKALEFGFKVIEGDYFNNRFFKLSHIIAVPYQWRECASCATRKI